MYPNCASTQVLSCHSGKGRKVMKKEWREKPLGLMRNSPRFHLKPWRLHFPGNHSLVLTGHHPHWFPSQLLQKPAFHDYFFMSFLISLPPAAQGADHCLSVGLELDWATTNNVFLHFTGESPSPWWSSFSDHLYGWRSDSLRGQNGEGSGSNTQTWYPGKNSSKCTVPIWTETKKIHQKMFPIALVPSLHEATATRKGMVLGFCCETYVGSKHSGTEGLFFTC